MAGAFVDGAILNNLPLVIEDIDLSDVGHEIVVDVDGALAYGAFGAINDTSLALIGVSAGIGWIVLTGLFLDHG